MTAQTFQAQTVQSLQNVQYITARSLVDVIDNFDGDRAMFGYMVYQSNARILKKDRNTREKSPVEAAFWESEILINMNVNYEKSVNRQLQKEGKEQLEFHKKERPWGQQVNDTENGSLIDHNGIFYLQAIPLRYKRTKLIDENGNEIDWLRNWDVFPKKSKPKNQGTDKPVEIRAYRFDRIKNLRIRGMNYKILTL